MLSTSRSAKALLGVTTLGVFSISDPTFAAAQTFLGNAASNAYGGTLQVQITVDNGSITAITTPVTPGGRNAQYSNYAVPTLTQEALKAQSANIQGVSGASAISSAWKQSLASAISKAGNALGTVTTPTPVVPTPVTPPPASTPASTPAPTKTIAPAPVLTPPPFYGGENENEGRENGEGSDDGYRAPRPKRSRLIIPNVPKASATPSSTAPSLTKGAAVIKKTITCVKGKVTKTVKATNPSTNPKCPAGYTLKKK